LEKESSFLADISEKGTEWVEGKGGLGELLGTWEGT
jgi:hypothetical protein